MTINREEHGIQINATWYSWGSGILYDEFFLETPLLLFQSVI